MTQVIPFTYDNSEVRTVIVDDEPWFVVADVCKFFGVTNRNRVMQNIDADERGVRKLPTLGGDQEFTVINEAGLYTLLFNLEPRRARGLSPDEVETKYARVKQFRKWVTHEVIPSIRKHGGYMAGQETMTPEEMALASMRWLQSKVDEQAKLLQAQAPKVMFADSVASSKTSILVGELAKILKGNGVEIGQNRLFAWLRDNGYLIKQRGEAWNSPTQYAMERGLFEVKESTHQQPDGTVRITRTTKVTGKGQQYFVNKLLTPVGASHESGRSIT